MSEPVDFAEAKRIALRNVDSADPYWRTISRAYIALQAENARLWEALLSDWFYQSGETYYCRYCDHTAAREMSSWWKCDHAQTCILASAP